MTDGNRCPCCGAESTDGGTERQYACGAGSTAGAETAATAAVDDGRTSVLGALEATVGHVPRLTLHD
ncbi:MAG: hypothetical protein ACYC61_32700, partial [Isosphaeraceae bacterium]